MRFSRDRADVDRLLRHNARQAVERLEAEHAPVQPELVAERVVYAHFHLPSVRAHRSELIANIADLIRDIRAAAEERP